ncbi:MAG: hypothetical protein P1P89_12490 [Desulfobacterales bacterium]|nr:hypothetical protein [Desulfobacterales bacterium]
MSPKIIQADKSYRRKIIVILFLIVLSGLALFLGLLPRINQTVHQIEPQKGLALVRCLLGVMFLAVVSIAIYLACFGRNVLKYRNFPPPGVKVLRDTRIVEGESATIYGQIIVLLSVLLFIFGLYGILITLYKLYLSIGQ